MAGEIKEGSIKNWPVDDRPREKLLKKGAKALSNSELLAILLRTGTSGSSAIDLARSFMKKFGTFRNMAHTDARDWKNLKVWEALRLLMFRPPLRSGDAIVRTK